MICNNSQLQPLFSHVFGVLIYWSIPETSEKLSIPEVESPEEPDPSPSPARTACDTQTTQESSPAVIQPLFQQNFWTYIIDLANICSNIQSYYVVPGGLQAPGVESAGYKEEQKPKADAISRLQYEVCSFTTKTTFLRQLSMSYWVF